METERRRDIQEAYNAANGITPKTIVKEISGMGVLEISSKDDSADKPAKRMSRAEIEQKINQLTREMREAAKILEFEHAAFLRDRIEKLRKQAGKENQALSTDKIVIKGAPGAQPQNVDVTSPATNSSS